MLVLLSEKPEYNDKIYAVSLMAPAGFMSHDGPLYQILSRILSPILKVIIVKGLITFNYTGIIIRLF